MVSFRLLMFTSIRRQTIYVKGTVPQINEAVRQTRITCMNRSIVAVILHPTPLIQLCTCLDVCSSIMLYVLATTAFASHSDMLAHAREYGAHYILRYKKPKNR
eukprot:scaffold334275_cov37-Prasinocladus_malaysianus.AAC.1